LYNFTIEEEIKTTKSQRSKREEI